MGRPQLAFPRVWLRLVPGNRAWQIASSILSSRSAAADYGRTPGISNVNADAAIVKARG